MNLQMAKCMLPVLLLCAPASALAQATPGGDGAELYARHCAICHGVFGQGDGHMAPDLEVTLQDLRDLAARNDGAFPEDYVRRIIDGRELRPLHGPAGMPVWGEVFSEFFGTEADSTEADEASAHSRLDAIVGFLRTLQRNPS